MRMWCDCHYSLSLCLSRYRICGLGCSWGRVGRPKLVWAQPMQSIQPICKVFRALFVFGMGLLKNIVPGLCLVNSRAGKLSCIEPMGLIREPASVIELMVAWQPASTTSTYGVGSFTPQEFAAQKVPLLGFVSSKRLGLLGMQVTLKSRWKLHEGFST